MVEATPARPYGGFTAELRDVQRNMRLRRELIEMFLNESKGEYFLTIPIYPMLGVGNYSAPLGEPHGPHADSEWVSDSIIHPHPRFGQLTSSIRERRGENVKITVPLFKDSKTREADGDTITADAMCFGMGNCCLQTTFQATCDLEARKLYDQLAVLGPIMMAVSAGSPMFKGKLMDQDTRWNIISASVDCRNAVERGEAANEPAPAKQFRRIAKSRYDSISSYISCSPHMDDKYNDVALELDEASYTRLREGGVPDRLARHVAHLFVREPLVMFEGIIELDDAKFSEHFENLQSTNWQTVRYKPPTSDNLKMGFRVEFRTMEGRRTTHLCMDVCVVFVYSCIPPYNIYIYISIHATNTVQLTDFENAAFCVFIALVSRAILYFDINMYVPMSVVDANMETAHKRDAVLHDKFNFRTRIVDGGAFTPATEAAAEEYAPMSCAEVICGRHFDYAPTGQEAEADLRRIEQEKKDMPGLVSIVEK
jgi:glutamate--cysteine ligase catalytic subunit